MDLENRRFNVNLKNVLNESFSQYRYGTRRKAANSLRSAKPIVPAKSIQSVLRPIFSKPGIRHPDIGDHPDFAHLKGSPEKEYCAITTMFMDIVGSTRLGLLFPLEEVQKIKNAFISVAIEIVQSFDGHVHRIMGDSVMAFFGGKNKDPDQSVIDALNAGATLNLFVEQLVIPRLTEEVGEKHKFGIRIGIDYGPRNSVLWSSYGYPGMDEVTATSFYVDVASKLQSSAPKNCIMIGESVRDQRDFPYELLDIKTVVKDGEEKAEPFLKPALTKKEGNIVHYDQYILKWKEYLRTTPLAHYIDQKNSATHPQIEVTVHGEREGVEETQFTPSGVVLDKGKHLKFKLSLPYQPRLPYTVSFEVENHGKDAEKSGESNNGNHKTTLTITNKREHEAISHWEYTKYKGLHFMTIIGRAGGKRLFDQKMGVYVK